MAVSSEDPTAGWWTLAVMRNFYVSHEADNRRHVNSGPFRMQAIRPRGDYRGLPIQDEHDRPACTDYRDRFVSRIQNECTWHPDLLK